MKGLDSSPTTRVGVSSRKNHEKIAETKVRKTKFWYLNGERHRENGPAVEWSNGSKEWWINGKFHREDGPAVEGASGAKWWYLNGTKLSEKLFKKVTQGPLNELPLYIGLGFDEYIGKRLRTNE